MATRATIRGWKCFYFNKTLISEIIWVILMITRDARTDEAHGSCAWDPGSKLYLVAHSLGIQRQRQILPFCMTIFSHKINFFFMTSAMTDFYWRDDTWTRVTSHCLASDAIVSAWRPCTTQTWCGNPSWIHLLNENL